MVVTTVGLEAISNIIGGSGVTINYIGVGSGYTAATVNDTALERPWDRNLCSERNIDTAKQCTYIGDWNSSEVSGLLLWEIGATNFGSELFVRHIVGSYQFNGDQEGQVQITLNFY